MVQVFQRSKNRFGNSRTSFKEFSSSKCHNLKMECCNHVFDEIDLGNSCHICLGNGKCMFSAIKVEIGKVWMFELEEKS